MYSEWWSCCPSNERKRVTRCSRRRDGEFARAARVLMSGSAEHALWLENQLNRLQPRAATYSAPPPENILPKFFSTAAIVASPPKPKAADTAAGSTAHDSWLRSQLNRRGDVYSASMHLQEPSTSLPPGVNRMLRGQDDSSLSHADWLDQQLSRGTPGRPKPTSARDDWLSQQLHRAASAQQPASGSPTRAYAAPPITPYQAPQKSQDCAAGSPRHAAWLEQQLTPRLLPRPV